MVEVTRKDCVERTLMEKLPELASVKDITDHSIQENADYQ